MELKTERLVIFEPTPESVESLIRNLNDFEVSKQLMLAPFPYTEKDAKQWINICGENAITEPRTDYDLFISVRENRDVIGGISITSINYNKKSGELGYWLGREFQRQGFMYEACRSILGYAFKELGLNEVIAGVFKDNMKSRSLLEKLGFKFKGEKEEKAFSKANPVPREEVTYVLKRENFGNQ